MDDAPAYRECTLVVGPDQYPIRYRRYSAPEGILRRGVIVAIHGIQSHAGWYDRSCRFFASRGFETLFFDRRGSGRNEKDRGDGKGRTLIEDVIAYVDHARNEAEGLPVCLLAISWGGKLAVLAARRRPDLADAFVFVCPGWAAKVEPSFREKLAIAWSSVLWPRRKLRVPLSDPALFTEQPEWQEFLRGDSLSLREASARLLMTSRLLDLALARKSTSIPAPALLLLAGKDRIIDNAAVRERFGKLGFSEEVIREYAGASHTLEFEPNAAEIFEDVADWLGSPDWLGSQKTESKVSER